MAGARQEGALAMADHIVRLERETYKGREFLVTYLDGRKHSSTRVSRGCDPVRANAAFLVRSFEIAGQSAEIVDRLEESIGGIGESTDCYNRPKGKH
jgi:hypothetical protein